MKRTYIDASVLLAAFQGEDDTSRRALEVLDDPARKLVVSDDLRLEVLPKPTFHKRAEDVAFMKAVLDGDPENVSTSPQVTGQAVELAGKYDMTPIDSLHVASAAIAAVDQLVTMEKPTKPICRVREAVKKIHSKMKTWTELRCEASRVAGIEIIERLCRESDLRIGKCYWPL